MKIRPDKYPQEADEDKRGTCTIHCRTLQRSDQEQSIDLPDKYLNRMLLKL